MSLYGLFAAVESSNLPCINLKSTYKGSETRKSDGIVIGQAGTLTPKCSTSRPQIRVRTFQSVSNRNVIQSMGVGRRGMSVSELPPVYYPK